MRLADTRPLNDEVAGFEKEMLLTDNGWKVSTYVCGEDVYQTSHSRNGPEIESR